MASLLRRGGLAGWRLIGRELEALTARTALFVKAAELAELAELEIGV